MDEKRKRIARLSGQLGASRRIAKPGYDGREATRAATEASQAERERAVDPEGILPEEERRRRAKHEFLARMYKGKLDKSKRQRGARERGAGA